MKSAPIETEEEQQMVKFYLVMEIMMTAIDREILKFEASNDFKLSRIFILKLRIIQRDTEHLMNDIRKQFRLRGIKIFEQFTCSKYIEAKYLCRGYQHGMTLQKDIVRSEIELQVAHDFGINLFDEVKV